MSTTDSSPVIHYLNVKFPPFSSFLLLPALCVMVAASIYTAQNKSFHVISLQEGSYGSSYILAWISFPMTLVSGLMYLVLRKRKWWESPNIQDIGHTYTIVLFLTLKFLLLFFWFFFVLKENCDIKLKEKFRTGQFSIEDPAAHLCETWVVTWTSASWYCIVLSKCDEDELGPNPLKNTTYI